MYYLLLGTNLGDRANALQKALTQIRKEIGQVIAMSSIYETEPWGLTEQPAFLNMAICVETDKTPAKMLQLCKAIESDAGEKSDQKWGPRNLDIDILYHGDSIYSDPELKIPHPLIAQRNFALVPLMEIAGEMIDPQTQLTIEEMYDQCTDLSEVYLYEENDEKTE